mmetsp:Transcript_22555/g.69981  ORF Transcript_22555/g.69981 Transcript_22555/m.69981 type:complete len:415 (+) Transcript_22555:226-1470(+)
MATLPRFGTLSPGPAISSGTPGAKSFQLDEGSSSSAPRGADHSTTSEAGGRTMSQAGRAVGELAISACPPPSSSLLGIDSFLALEEEVGDRGEPNRPPRNSPLFLLRLSSSDPPPLALPSSLSREPLLVDPRCMALSNIDMTSCLKDAPIESPSLEEPSGPPGVPLELLNSSSRLSFSSAASKTSSSSSLSANCTGLSLRPEVKWPGMSSVHPRTSSSAATSDLLLVTSTSPSAVTRWNSASSPEGSRAQNMRFSLASKTAKANAPCSSERRTSWSSLEPPNLLYMRKITWASLIPALPPSTWNSISPPMSSSMCSTFLRHPENTTMMSPLLYTTGRVFVSLGVGLSGVQTTVRRTIAPPPETMNLVGRPGIPSDSASSSAVAAWTLSSLSATAFEVFFLRGIQREIFLLGTKT